MAIAKHVFNKWMWIVKITGSHIYKLKYLKKYLLKIIHEGKVDNLIFNELLILMVSNKF